ncbi:MAG: dihydropteroate synthase [Planctomycetota bacterium]
MILIGERINAGFKDVKAAIQNKDASVIKEWARKQADAKANYLDICMGTASSKAEDLCWMIEMVQEEVDLPISIDANKINQLREAIPVCKKPPLINSTTAVDAKLDELLPLIAAAKGSVIGLVMDEEGSPKTVEKRIENAGKIFAKIMEYGMEPHQLFLDPIIMPLKFMQEQAKVILAAARQFQIMNDPPCHIVCGLSNVSNGTTQKKLINRTFCGMMIGAGLDAVILDVCDKDLVDTIITADLIMNNQIYADSYVEAFRK